MGMDLETTKGRRRGGENERELIVINSLLTVLLLYTVIIFANDKLGNLGVILRVDNRPIKRTKRVEQANNILFTLNYFLHLSPCRFSRERVTILEMFREPFVSANSQSNRRSNTGTCHRNNGKLSIKLVTNRGEPG